MLHSAHVVKAHLAYHLICPLAERLKHRLHIGLYALQSRQFGHSVTDTPYQVNVVEAYPLIQLIGLLAESLEQ
jgi:hypothetical protein